eukprot:TRINITY_DN7675_c0_g1_i8.p1 TRINITY_DN7675_c0_g1~~TRINITY_DN7675_c0_g1_i8.p1  ORF type:complete len:276 (+),score=27.91 TRINITY_DN7675_c0_g1_i8:102-830(+)
MCIRDRNEKIYDIVALTDNMLFFITQKGTIRNQKKLDYTPATIHIYDHPETKTFATSAGEQLRIMNYMIGTFYNHVLVYSEMQLVWATRTEHVVHGLDLGTFQGQKNLIVTLSDNGWLQVTYLGTEPPNTVVQNVEIQEQKYEVMDKEYTRLQEEIARAENTVKKDPDEEMHVVVQVNTKTHSKFEGSCICCGFRPSQQNSRTTTLKMQTNCSRMITATFWLEDSTSHYRSPECELPTSLFS